MNVTDKLINPLTEVHSSLTCEEDLYLRLLLVADYISGMTDTYAKDLCQALQGIY